jgi:hypothetical protein
MLSDSDFNLSQGLFMDLVSNVKAIKSGSNNAFLIYPRILSVILQKVLPEKVFKKGESMQMKSLTDETFTRMLGSNTQEKVSKVSKVSKTQTKRTKTTTVVQTSVVEPTAPGDHGTTSSAVKPTPATSKRKRPSTKTTTKTKKGPLEDEIPEENPVATQRQQETTVVTSSQQMDISQPEQTPHESSQKDHVVSQREPHHETY